MSTNINVMHRIENAIVRFQQLAGRFITTQLHCKERIVNNKFQDIFNRQKANMGYKTISVGAMQGAGFLAGVLIADAEKVKTIAKGFELGTNVTTSIFDTKKIELDHEKNMIDLEHTSADSLHQSLQRTENTGDTLMQRLHDQKSRAHIG